MEAGPLRQPGPYLGVLVGALVVHNQVDMNVLGDELLDLAQEAQELLVPVAGPALGQNLTGGDVQSGEQGGGAVADVVVGDAFHVAQAHGQQRLGAVESLDLRLLIHAEHHRLIGRVQVETDDVADFLDKEGIRGELERFLPVGLDREGLQPAVNRGLGDPSRCSQSPSAPVGAAIRRPGLQRPVDHLRHLVVLIGAGPAGAELVVQTFQPQLPVALAPLADGHARQAHAFGDGGVGFTSSAGQHDLRALHDRMR